MGLKDRLYRIDAIPSKAVAIHWEGFENAAARLGQGLVIAYLYQGLKVGAVRDGTIAWLDASGADGPSPDERFVSGISLFNENFELRYWRDGGHIVGRERQDGTGPKASYVDAGMALRGVVAENLLSSYSVKPGETLGIQTRNYISENQTGQSGYFDSRFVQIIKL